LRCLSLRTCIFYCALSPSTDVMLGYSSCTVGTVVVLFAWVRSLASCLSVRSGLFSDSFPSPRYVPHVFVLRIIYPLHFRIVSPLPSVRHITSPRSLSSSSLPCLLTFKIFHSCILYSLRSLLFPHLFGLCFYLFRQIDCKIIYL